MLISRHYVNGKSAGTEILGKVNGTATVSAQSALVLVKDTSLPLFAIVLIIAAAGVIVVVIVRRRKTQGIH